jgi:hypothetical protein
LSPMARFPTVVNVIVAETAVARGTADEIATLDKVTWPPQATCASEGANAATSRSASTAMHVLMMITS